MGQCTEHSSRAETAPQHRVSAAITWEVESLSLSGPFIIRTSQVVKVE